MKTFFKDKFNYNYISNQKVIEAIEGNPQSFSNRLQTLISHTFNAHTIWNNRILKNNNNQGVWDLFLLKDLHLLNKQNYQVSLKILEECNLDTTINYVNSSGVKYSNKTEDILYHIINHSTYHRGQIITELKENGVVPVVTDYIFFKR
jgi:uncharacterized damage-inducible protein DinB